MAICGFGEALSNRVSAQRRALVFYRFGGFVFIFYYKRSFW
jgi:hypothetical protein